jgi:hypothetical protein
MDHTDIRGLSTAIHWSVAGLPRSKVGDHRADAYIVRPRIPLIGARASRDQYVVGPWKCAAPSARRNGDANGAPRSASR